MNSYRGESLVGTRLDEVGALDTAGYCPVHQSVLLDEVEVLVVQQTGVVVTSPRPAVRLVMSGQWEPVGVDTCLALERSLKAVQDVAHLEAADCASSDGILRRVEDSIDRPVLRVGVDDLGHGLDLVKVEGISSRHGAVESRLGECCPLILECVRATVVLLTDSGHSAVHRLR